MENGQKPFSIDYVLKTTARHMRKSIDISIRKTFERIEEFEKDSKKSDEIFRTLAKLHGLRKQVDEFHKQNQNPLVKGE